MLPNDVKVSCKHDSYMLTLKDICNLEYLIFAFLIQHWDSLHFKNNCYVEHPIVLLKKLYKDLGFFREDYLGLLFHYRGHLVTEFHCYKNIFDYLSRNFDHFVDCYHKNISWYIPEDLNDYL